MKSRTWALILGAVLLVCLGLSAPMFLPGEAAAAVEIWSDGKLVETVLLAQDRVLTVESANGTNVITVRGGAIAVTEADCPDHHCTARGFCRGGMQIVCLPNRLVIKFVGKTDLDSVVG